jgi:hypothetical protein
MYTIQDLDRLVSRVRRLSATAPSLIAADIELVDELRAVWAEAFALEAELIPMAFTEYEGVEPHDPLDQTGGKPTLRRDKGFQQVYDAARKASWDTSSLGEAEDNPMGWLVMVMAVKHRATAKLQWVNKMVLNMGQGR